MNENTHPKLSVVMTAYNSSRVIHKTLEALLGQTYRDFELIIVDDCSKDDTVAIIEGFNDPRIKLVRNDKNQGISRSRNIGLDLAKGDYVAMSDHDDLSLPTRLEKQVAFLDSHPDYIMVTCDCVIQSGQSRRAMTVIANPYLLHWTLFYRCPLVHSATCIRRAAADRAGIRYNPAYAYAEDFHFYHLLARVGKLGAIAEPLVVYLIHEHNTTHSILDDMIRNGLAFMQEQYRDVLGIADRSGDVELLWKACTLDIPLDNVGDLRRLGEFLVASCECFIQTQQPGETDRALLWQDVGKTWWKAVRISAEKRGKPALLSAYDPNLHTGLGTPAGLEWLQAYAFSMLRRIISTLRH